MRCYVGEGFGVDFGGVTLGVKSGAGGPAPGAPEREMSSSGVSFHTLSVTPVASVPPELGVVFDVFVRPDVAVVGFRGRIGMPVEVVVDFALSDWTAGDVASLFGPSTTGVNLRNSLELEDASAGAVVVAPALDVSGKTFLSAVSRGVAARAEIRLCGYHGKEATYAHCRGHMDP